MTALNKEDGVSAEDMVATVWTIFRADFPPATATKPKNMNKNNHPNEVIVSGIHLELTPSMKSFVREKADRLFRHEERIVRVRVELECDPRQDVTHRFTAKGHIQINGPDLNATVEAEECHKAAALLVDKLDQMLRRRAKLFKSKRHDLHAVEWDDVALPKAV
jgi:putative sigma-54 modulation protein